MPDEPKDPEITGAPAAEIVEDVDPAPIGTRPIVESGPVPPGLPVILRENSPDPDHSVRTGLAWALTLLLCALAVMAAGGWLFAEKGLEDFQAYLLVMSPIVTLTGTILGFYFSTARPAPARPRSKSKTPAQPPTSRSEGKK